MSKSEVLIAFSTRFGCTEDTANRIADALKKKGITSEVFDLKKTRKNDWPSVDFFRGVLVGSGIRAGRWMNEPRNFLNMNREALNEKVLGVFVCSGYAGVQKSYAKAKEDYIDTILGELEIEADIADAFGGMFDFSPGSRMGFLDRKIAEIAAKQLVADTDEKFDSKGKYDLRDWNRINQFIDKFVKKLPKK